MTLWGSGVIILVPSLHRRSSSSTNNWPPNLPPSFLPTKLLARPPFDNLHPSSITLQVLHPALFPALQLSLCIRSQQNKRIPRKTPREAIKMTLYYSLVSMLQQSAIRRYGTSLTGYLHAGLSPPHVRDGSVHGSNHSSTFHCQEEAVYV